MRSRSMVPSTLNCGTAPGGSGPSRCYVNRARSVHYRGIDSRDVAGNNAVVRVDRGRLADLDVARLRLGDLQRGLQLVELDHLGHRRSRRHVLAHLHRRGQRRQRAGDAGPHLKRLRLLLVEIEQRLGLVDLGLLRGKLHLDRLLVHVELLHG